MKKKNKGQAVIETAAVAPLFFLLILSFLYIVHGAVSYFLVDHFAYEAALCVESLSKFQCQNELKNKVRVLPGLHLQDSQIREQAGTRTVTVRWQSLFYKQQTEAKVDLSQLSSQ